MYLMRRASILVLLLPLFSYADSSSSARRDAALRAINACAQRQGRNSACKKLNANVQTLVEVYKQGDRTVLPTLFKFTYLTDFYGDALLADAAHFLDVMGQLPDKDQKAVAAGIAGGMFGLRAKNRFEALRQVLKEIPESDATKPIAQLCLRSFERQNASFTVAYFPPQTFTSAAKELQLRWYSSDMYALGEKPLWPASIEPETTYRLTYLPAFTGPTVITMTTSPHGAGSISIKSISGDREVAKLDEKFSVSPDQVSRSVSLLDQAHFWGSPAELPSHGLDGAEWIMEGVKDGQYRVVVRWCPDIDHQSAEEIPFADAGHLMFELAGHQHAGGC